MTHLVSFMNLIIFLDVSGLGESISYSVSGNSYWMRTSLNWRHSRRMCLTVIIVPQVVHDGGSSLAIKYPCDIRVWPIRRRTRITSSLLDISYGLGHGSTVCFISLSLLLLQLVKKHCHSSIWSNLIKFRKSWSDV